jgi:signal transduction histidine kinase/ligand-binding sensor domain-containing protein/CheY-like chemotaxis protein
MSPPFRILAALLLLAGAVPAQHYRFRHYGPEEGLSTAVSRLLQDRAGFLWVGTGNGLFRYDGTRFQHFGTDDGLPSTSIRCLHETPDGTIWVVTGRGLARFRHRSFEVVSTDSRIEGSDFHAIDSAPDGRLYLGTERGLFAGRIDAPSKEPAFRAVAGTPAEPVTGIFVESDHSVWFGCGLRLCLLQDGRLRTFGAAEGLPPDRWGALVRSPDRTLWVRGAQHLSVLPQGAEQFASRDDGLPQSSNTMLSMIVDRTGMVLVSTDLGLARWRNGQWDLIGSRQGLESDTITAVLQDREGSIWVGMWGAGIARWTGYAEWANWTTADGLSNNLVWAIRRQPSGSHWVGTDRGLVELREGVARRVLTKKDGLGGDKIKGLATGPDGALWAACLPGGVSRIDPGRGRIRTYGAQDGLADDRVVALHVDTENRLWASTGDGLFRSNGLGTNLRFVRQRPPGASEHSTFFRFLQDRHGRVWVGSADGLFRWDHGQWTRFSTRDGLKVNGVTHIAETADGAIWFAYREPVGMSRLTLTGGHTQIQHFSMKDGLPTDYIMFLGLDSGQRLWVGTDNGVAVRAGESWRIYTHEDGMVWDDCAANSFWADPDGAVWIGTLKGMSRFKPGGQPLPAPGPPAVITAVKFAGRPADPSEYREVSFRDHDFLVAFSGLSFLSESKMQFRYRLSGIDDSWVETASREARYSGLPAGAYRFEVAARNLTGPWTPVPAAVAFRVVPAWWQTWLFRICAGALLLALAAWTVRARMRNMMFERRKLETAVRERTSELECQKNLVEQQKHEIENLLRQSQEASRLKSEFLANMSHEIRTPMNGVLGMTQLVLHTSLDEEQREYMNTVRESAEALLVVINDILDFSKIEAGKMELRHDPFLVRECVADAVQVFGWKAREKGLVMLQEVAPDVPPVLAGDADRIRQILLNLLGNAIKFTERGNITVEVSLGLGESLAAAPCVVCFSVKDTGVGIPSDKQSMIFDAFAQADGSTKRQQGGTGLGLAICTKLVRLMKGRIWVESTPGSGSKFAFTVALEQSDGLPAPSPEEPAPVVLSGPPVRPLRVLLAEDNLVNQKLVQRVLERMGHSVTLVPDGRHAVEAAAREQFDAILMDVQMPEMDGFEATGQIRTLERSANPRRARVPIVALTAHAMSGDREQCLLAGMDDYLSKPIQLETLAALLNRMAAERPVPAI